MKRIPDSSQHRASKPRRAVVLVAVLVCAAVASAVVAGIVTSALRQRQQLRQEMQMEQTRWLLEAGLAHAAEKCRGSEDYRGESMVLASRLRDGILADVQIEVQLDESDRKTVTVTATIRGEGAADSATRRSRTLDATRP